MQISTTTRLVLGFVPAMIALVLVGWLSYRQLDDTADDAHWVSHSLEVLQHLETARAGLAEAETHAQEFRLSNSEGARQAAREAALGVSTAMAEVLRMTQDNNAQVASAERLQAKLTLLGSEMRRALEPPAAPGSAAHGDRMALLDAVFTDFKRHAREARDSMEAMEATERSLLSRRRQHSVESARNSALLIALATSAAILTVAGLALMNIRAATKPLADLEQGAVRVGQGDYSHRLPVRRNDQLGQIARIFNEMVEQLQQRDASARDADWVKNGVARFVPLFQTARGVQELCDRTVRKLTDLLPASSMALYLVDGGDEPALLRRTTFAADHAPERIERGQGFAGQCWVKAEAIELDGVPLNYVPLQSALGQSPPRHIVVLPLCYDNDVKGVLEIASLHSLTAPQREFLDRLVESFGLALQTMYARQATESALAAETALAQALLEQQQQLRQRNEELAQSANELSRLNGLLQQSNEDLASANQELDAFCASVSHDLRTPLAHIVGFAQLLDLSLGDKLSPNEREHVRTIYAAGMRMNDMVNNFLNFARVDRRALQKETVDMADLVRSVINEQAADRPREDVRWEIGELPVTQGDPEMLRHVWSNLVSNALKYSRNRHPARIEIRGEVKGPEILYWVKDNGAGFDPSRADKLFTAFSRLHPPSEFEGIGVGLSSIKRVVQRHGGRVWAEGQVDQGATFYFSLPKLSVESKQEDHELA